MSRNKGSEVAGKVASILRGEDEIPPDGLTPSDIAGMKYLPTVTADVERSFSAYKLLLSDRRHRMTEENIRRHLIVSCYFSSSEEG